MKKFLTVQSVLFHSFIVVIFAACGVNTSKNAEICSHSDSNIFIPENKFVRKEIEDNSHPIFLNKQSDFEKQSHPMVVALCPKLED